MKLQKRILVCPLNWGLGHATRCMPLIDELARQGVEVLLASDGEALALLKKEYPGLPSFSLPSYNIRYGEGGMMLTMARQLPVILKAINREKKAVRQLVSEHDIDAIISDNRYGCRVGGMPSVFLSHQLNVRIPLKWLEFPVRQMQFRLIRQFDECWVPDFEGEPNLSGDLGHGIPLRKIRYIGPQSRMQRIEKPLVYDVVAVLSGPEPQRSLLEEKLTRQLLSTSLKALLVRGKADEPFEEKQTGSLEIVTYLTAKELNEKMASAKLIISRSGYSSIMDLVKIGKPAILIPTPGQTEQEYLAARFNTKKWFLARTQEGFHLGESLAMTNELKPGSLDINPGLLEEAVTRFLERL